MAICITCGSPIQAKRRTKTYCPACLAARDRETKRSSSQRRNAAVGEQRHAKRLARVCTNCGVSIADRGPGAKRCEACQKARSKLAFAITSKKWRIDNAHLERERQRRWVAENRATHIANTLRWNKAHPLVGRLREARRRARIRSAAGSGLTAAQLAEILELHDHRCAYCLDQFAAKDLTIDHVVAISRGGDHDPENIVPACRPCNSRKHDYPIWVMLTATSPGYLAEFAGGPASTSWAIG